MGILINFEGIDGAGKGTQAAQLQQSLKEQGLRVTLFGFPRYRETFFGQGIGEFLNGAFGNLDEVHPLLVSLLFAGDRFESRDLLREALATQDVVICDRYVPSNVAHQSGKLQGAARQELRARIEHLEYVIYQLPRPQLVVLLDMPPVQARELITRKAARSYTTSVADLQEADTDHLRATRDYYLELAAGDPCWKVVRCCPDGMLRSLAEIAAEIRELVHPLLPPQT